MTVSNLEHGNALLDQLDAELGSLMEGFDADMGKAWYMSLMLQCEEKIARMDYVRAQMLAFDRKGA